MSEQFADWFERVKAIVKENHPIYLIGGPDPDNPEPPPIPHTDEYVAEWAANAETEFRKMYEKGDDPHSALFDWVAG